MADEEIVHHPNYHGNQRDAKEDPHFMIELLNLHLMRSAQCGLNQVIERRIPGVDGNPDFNQKPGHKDNQRRAQYGPILPTVWTVDKPERGEQADAEKVICIKNQVIQRPEPGGADRHITRCAGDMCNPGSPTCLPEYNGDQCPNKCRNKERSRLWEKRRKHSALLLTSYRYDDCCAFASVQTMARRLTPNKHMLKPTIVTRTDALSSLPALKNCFYGFHT